VRQEDPGDVQDQVVVMKSADQIHADRWIMAVAEFGDRFSVPRQVAQSISDEVRAAECLAVWIRDGRQTRLVSYLRSMMIPDSIIEKMASEVDGEAVVKDESGRIVVEKKARRKRDDLMKDLISWLDEHPYEMVTVKSLCEIAGVAHMTIRKFICDRPDYFRAGEKRGEFEVRNRKADRERDGK
jgi:hypothetical protein